MILVDFVFHLLMRDVGEYEIQDSFKKLVKTNSGEKTFLFRIPGFQMKPN